MQKFVDLRMSGLTAGAVWNRDADEHARSPLDAINDEHWSEAWMANNDEDFGNPDLALLGDSEQDSEYEPERA